MIHTKEPANVFYVYLTAYRSYESLEVNEMMLKGLIARIRTYPGTYGNIESINVQGCFKEDGSDTASTERTLRVRCTKESQVAELTWLACHNYNQDAVLTVNSQTHTAELNSIKMVGGYARGYSEVHSEKLPGTFQRVEEPKGECYSILEDGSVWEVIE